MADRRANANSGAKNTKAATMSPRGDRSKRLLDLVMLLLRARSPVTFRTIREQFTSYKTANVEAGLRAFERDKADLLELGVPIRYVTPEEDDALDEGGYLVDLKRYRLPEVQLTADEVSALVLAASVARAVPGGMTPKIVDLALRKLAFDTHESPDTPTEFLPSVSEVTAKEPLLVHFPVANTPEARSLSDRFALMEAATRNRKRVSISYRSASTGVVQGRDVDPYALFYRQGSWLTVGYCHLRKEIRSFRLDRITELRPAPRPKSPDFERPSDFDLRTYVDRSPWTFRTEPTQRVKLEIRPEAADIANEDFGTGAEKTKGSDGSQFVAFDCGNPEFVVSRILAANGGLRIVEGTNVTRRLQQELTAIQERYEQGAST